jgi:hypothetical protein
MGASRARSEAEQAMPRTRLTVDLHMKSSKQRRAELDAKKEARRAKSAAELAEAARIEDERLAALGITVKFEALARTGSYDRPKFVKRGFYVDTPFECVDCGKAEVWTATQQKWWFEVAKGDMWTTARRCRPCRRRERERREAARQAQEPI